MSIICLELRLLQSPLMNSCSVIPFLGLSCFDGGASNYKFKVFSFYEFWALFN
jgi:hypothetical protein